MDCLLEWFRFSWSEIDIIFWIDETKLYGMIYTKTVKEDKSEISK